jgi:biflaviolin synthase
MTETRPASPEQQPPSGKPEPTRKPKPSREPEPSREPSPPGKGKHPVHYWPVDDLPGITFDPLLTRLLHTEPVARIKLRFGEGHAWLATRYEDVKEVSSDPRLSRAATLERPVTSMTPHRIGLPGAVGRTDPPDHTRLRRLVARSFNRKRVEDMRPHAQAIADRQLDLMEEHGPPADLAEYLTGPLPTEVISVLMGVPREDWERVHQWREVVLSTSHPREEGDAVKAEIGRYFGALARRRAAAPEDDLYSELATAQAEGRLSHQELVSLAVIIQLNAMDAVRNITSSMIYTLLTHPDQFELLREDPSRVPKAVEELFRFVPLRNGVGQPRIATEEIRVGDVTVPAGDAVHVSYIAANRDPSVFRDPDRLDLTRDAEAPHLAFGHGAHYCVGAALSTMQAEVVVSTLLRRMPRLRLAVAPEEVPWRRGTLNRGPERLPVAW